LQGAQFARVETSEAAAHIAAVKNLWRLLFETA
jgi:hypothetical protein